MLFVVLLLAVLSVNLLLHSCSQATSLNWISKTSIMAKRKSTPEVPKQSTALLTVEREYFESELKKRIVIGEEIYERKIQAEPQLQNAMDEYYAWNDYNSELLKQFFDNPDNEYKIAYDRVNSGWIFASPNTPVERLADFKDDVK